MKSLKKYVMGLVAMTIAIGAVTLMSMSAGMFASQEVWYDVSGNSDTPSDLQITSGPSSTPNNSPTCNINLDGKPCGVHLSFPSNNAPTSIPPGTTVQDLMTNYGATIVLNDNDEPNFTRKQEE